MRAVLGSLLAVGLAGAPAFAQLADAPWPKFQHDAQNTGRSHIYNGPAGPDPQIAWEYQGRVGRTAVTIGNGGIVYVGDGKRPITALSSDDGSVLWQMTNGITGQAARSTPTLSDDGHVYIGERGNNLWSADSSDGSIDWKFFVPSDGDIRVSPAIRSDGVIFMASGSLGAGFLYGINPNGTQKWLNPMHDFLSGNTFTGSSAIPPHGVLVLDEQPEHRHAAAEHATTTPVHSGQGSAPPVPTG